MIAGIVAVIVGTLLLGWALNASGISFVQTVVLVVGVHVMDAGYDHINQRRRIKRSRQ
jgi:multisubunit Na+/H+ antiporter MnhB subunit